MNYYEKLGWKLGKENEIFLKKGPEKLFFEILEKLDPKYVKVFKELLKYINKNSIVNFIPYFFPDGKNEENQTYDDFMEKAGKYSSVELIKIIEIESRTKEKLLNFDEAIVESEIWLRSNNLKTTTFAMKKKFDVGFFDVGFDTGNYKLEFFSNNNLYIGYEKKYNNYFIVDNERRNGEIFEMNSSNIFETMTYDSENYKPKKTPFNFFNRHPIVSFVIIELLKEEGNYLFKDFSKEMRQILNKGMNINVFFKYFKIRGEINELKEINSKKEYFVKFLEEQKWNKYRNKIPFALNLILFRAPKLINENVLRETAEKEDRIIKNFIKNFKKIGEGRFGLQYLFGIIFLLERIEINSERIPKVITLMQDTFSMAQELEIQIDLTKINSEKALKKKHNKFLKEINLRARLREKEKLETVFVFPEKFNPVIENLGAEYELIRDGKRLLEEGEEQCNCVFSYFKKITEGKCLIYSFLGETEKSPEDISDSLDNERKRYTIEIIERDGKFEAVQFLGKFNKKDAETVKLEAELREKLKKINTISMS